MEFPQFASSTNLSIGKHLHSLYPKIEPFRQHYIKVSSLHHIYVEQCGNQNGIPVVFLHGGPGSGCKEKHRRYFDPAIYHVILFDQRGCGRSTPQGELAQNNTAALVKDIDIIRAHIGISKWLVFGGSWGATLGLLYTQQYPHHVLGMILRGVFLARPQDINWAYSSQGAAQIYPEAWQNLMNTLSYEQQQKPLQSIYNNLIDTDEQVSRNTYNQLQQWECKILNITPPVPKKIGDTFNKNATLIQLHFSINNCFIDEDVIIKFANKLQDTRMHIIHGRYDFVCPVEQAWLLTHHCPHASLRVLEKSGHLADEPLMIDALIAATIAFNQ